MLEIDAISSGKANNSQTLTFAHTCSGINRVLIVGVACNGYVLTSVTYAGVGMTKKAEASESSGYAYIWSLIDPATGANNIVITSSDEYANIEAGGISFINAIQDTPIGGTATSSGSGTQAAPNITSQFSESILVDCLRCDGVSTDTLTASNSTKRWDQYTAGYTGRGAGSSVVKAVAGAYQFVWNFNRTLIWAWAGVEVKGIPGSGNFLQFF